MDKKSLMIIALSVSITLGLSLAAQSLMAAWTSPAVAPPGGNVAAPLNVGSTQQCKEGKIKANGGFVLDTMTAAQENVTTFETGQMWMVVGTTPLGCSY
jgi:hypothetical protein